VTTVPAESGQPTYSPEQPASEIPSGNPLQPPRN
jgi:hypothetical protein